MTDQNRKALELIRDKKGARVELIHHFFIKKCSKKK